MKKTSQSKSQFADIGKNLIDVNGEQLESVELKSNPSNSSGSIIIRLGIMCVEKKLASRPMREILSHLGNTPEIQILKFNDQMLFNEPIENWH